MLSYFEITLLLRQAFSYAVYDKGLRPNQAVCYVYDEFCGYFFAESRYLSVSAYTALFKIVVEHKIPLPEESLFFQDLIEELAQAFDGVSKFFFDESVDDKGLLEDVECVVAYVGSDRLGVDL